MSDPISIRIAPRRSLENVRSDSREAFWSRLRKTEEFPEESVEQLEAKLLLEFGPALRNGLVSSVRDELAEFERGVFGSEFPHEMWRFLDHELHFMRREKGQWPFPWTDPLVKYFELRQHALSESDQFRTLLQRVSAAAAVRFSTRIRGYGSLNLDVFVGSVEKLSRVFDDNFDTFRVFLDCFVPAAFGDVFVDDYASQMHFDIALPGALQKAFKKQRHEQRVAPTRVERQPEVMDVRNDAARKAEWVWRLANGSLLIPVLLALAVLYFGWRELSSLRDAQYEALKPVIEHQMELLKEDRERLLFDRKTETRNPPPALPLTSQPPPQAGANVTP